MADTFNFPGNYQIEVSGWGLDNAFFSEKTDLLWSPSGDKQALLHRALPEGAMIFVRLLTVESTNRSMPVPYQVEEVRPMDCNGQCELRLIQLYPQLKRTQYEGKLHPYLSEDSLSMRPSETTGAAEVKEMLQ